MHQDIKSCIIDNGEKSNVFSCEMDVRQEENLSPFLFAIFLNDLQEKDLDSVKSITCDLEYVLTVLLKIFYIVCR